MNPETVGEEIVEYIQPAIQAPSTLFRTDDPVEIVERATRTANALMGAIRKHDEGKPPAQKLVSVISGREHPKVECWTMLGAMLGVFPVTVWTHPLDNGWEARVEARTRDGAIVGAAEAQCTRSEKEWGPNPTKGKPRDDYALRSMAQTRATSKALRQPLGFVAILAGLEGTPAEEMPRDEDGERGYMKQADQKTGQTDPAWNWRDWTYRMNVIGVPPDDSREWLRQACDALGIESLQDADPDVRKGVMERARAVLVTLSDGTDWALTTGARAGIAGAFAQAFDGAVVDGPAWRLGPDEADQPAADVLAPVAGEDPSIPFGE